MKSTDDRMRETANGSTSTNDGTILPLLPSIAIDNYDHYNTSILYEQSTIKSLTVIPQHKGHIIDSLPITDTNCCCQWRLHLKATTITT